METVKCISLWQPWASLCCTTHPLDVTKSVKGFETRSWRTSYRGPLLIHAAQRFTAEERTACYEPLIRESLRRSYRSLADVPRGAIIGRVELVECHPAMAAVSEADEYARAMGYYAPGRFAWEITRPMFFREPIPYRGQQGLFDVPLAVVNGEEVEQ